MSTEWRLSRLESAVECSLVDVARDCRDGVTNERRLDEAGVSLSAIGRRRLMDGFVSDGGSSSRDGLGVREPRAVRWRRHSFKRASVQ